MNTIVAFPMSSIASFMPRLLQSRWFQWIQAGVEDGTVDAVLGNLGSTVLSVMKLIGFENSAAVDDTWIRAYSSPFGTREECIGGVSFPLDVVTGKMAQIEEPPPEGVEALFGKPAMLAEGMRDQAIPPEVAIEVFRSMFGDRPVVELPRAGHFCQEDAPETLVSLIQQFVQANP